MLAGGEDFVTKNATNQSVWRIGISVSGAGLGTDEIFVNVPTSIFDRTTGAYTNTNILKPGTWLHIASVFDGSQTGNSNRLKIYVNGVSQNLTFAGTIPSSTQTAPSSAVIGGPSSGSGATFFNGVIDDVRIYTRALSQDEITQLYNTGSGGTDIDATPPTTPTNISAIAVSQTQINLSWNASSDNVGVAGYKIFRNGSQIATSTNTTYSDIGLVANTTYSYTVAAYDAAANTSEQSSSVNTTTAPQPQSSSICGNNITEAGEACDGTNLNGFSCMNVSAGFKSGTLRCSNDCKQYDVSSCVAGDMINALSCNQADAQNAINNAKDGDIVQIPAGNCVWSAPINITKGIVLRGNGENKTVITANNTKLMTINIMGRPFRLTSMGFTGTANSNYLAAFSIDGNIQNFRIDHLNIKNIIPANGTDSFRIFFLGYNGFYKPYPAITGVFDHITSTNIVEETIKTPFFINIYGKDKSWEDPDDAGTSKAIYFEDNNFFWSPSSKYARYGFDGEHGARFVFRNNLVNTGALSWHDTGSNRSTRWFEIYDNTFTSQCNSSNCPLAAIAVRGGTGTVYNNTIHVVPKYPNKRENGYQLNSGTEIFRVSYVGGSIFPHSCDSVVDRICSNITKHCSGGDHRACLFDADCFGIGTCGSVCTSNSECPSGTVCLDKFDGHQDSTGWPCRDQTGRGQDDPVTHEQSSDPLYWWNNKDQTGNYLQLIVSPANSNFIKEGRDYYNNIQRPDYTPYVYPHPLVQLDAETQTQQTAQCGFALNTCARGTAGEILDTNTHYMWECTNSQSTAFCSLAKEQAQTDSDNDGVLDSLDRCPNTKPTIPKNFINIFGCPMPIATKFDIRPDFNASDLTALTNFEIGILGTGKISYTNKNISLTRLVSNQYDQPNLDSDINISAGKITVNPANISSLNQSATITLYGINAQNPAIKKDGATCTQCTIISYDRTSGTLVFTVPGF